jgi:hypothetical protein
MLNRRAFVGMIPPCVALTFRAGASQQDEQKPVLPPTAEQKPMSPTTEQKPALPPTELMMHATVRIECVGANGSASSGTGFFFAMFQTQTESVPVIMTNKHVFGQNLTAAFFLTLAKPDGSPDLGNKVRVDVSDLPNKWIGHPDPKVDLAIMPCADILRRLIDQRQQPFVVYLDQSIIPSDDALKFLLPVEDILVVGYPDGIWDAHNNAPSFGAE